MLSATFTRLIVLFVLVCGLSGLSRITAQDKSPHFNKDEAFRTDVQIVVKRFWIAARQQRGDKMRETIDPKYIANHELDKGEFKFPEIATNNLYDVKIASDKSTVLCQIEKDRGLASIVLLRLVKRGGQLFVQPPTPPASESKIVVPWLLHAKLTAEIG